MNSINRRRFVSSLGLLGMAGVCPAKPFTLSSLPVSDDKSILKAGPYLQSPGTDKITIRWLTHVSCYSWVEYGDSKDQLDKKAKRVDYGLIQAYNTVNAITINDLHPGKTYFYRVCSKKIDDFKPYNITYGDTYTSEVFTFETINHEAQKVSFLIFNDIHDHPESFPLLMQYQGDDKKDFVFLNGDMFDFQTDEDQLVNHLLQPFAGLFATVPFFFSRGNHETRGKFARHLPEYFNSEEPKFYFTFQYGPMYAIVLDSGEDKTDDSKEYYGIVDFDNYREQQAEWLKKEVQKKEFKKAKYKIVFSHIPLYHAGEWHGTQHCRKVWGDILNDAHIDLLISGHTHVYGIHPPVKGEHNYPVVIGGGPNDTKRTIMRVTADHEAFKLDMIDDKGKLVGSIKV